jgi:hypothetical protein
MYNSRHPFLLSNFWYQYIRYYKLNHLSLLPNCPEYFTAERQVLQGKQSEIRLDR